MSKPLVSIICTAFNHEMFIERCIEGFLMQKTTFKFEVLINEDASIDNTAKIIQKYEERFPHVIKPIYQIKNQYSRQIGLWRAILFPKAQGKYIAICEGDDYWTDPLKLQKQVDFLENNPDFSFICGGFRKMDFITGVEEIVSLEPIRPNQYIEATAWEITYEDMKHSWVTKTLTSIFRSGCLDFKEMAKYRIFRDVMLFYLLKKAGRGLYMKEVLGVYRIHSGGIHSGASLFEKAKMDYDVFKEIYILNPKDDYARFRLLNSNLLLLHFKMGIGRKKWRECLKSAFLLIRNREDAWFFIKEMLKLSINYPIKT